MDSQPPNNAQSEQPTNAPPEKKRKAIKDYSDILRQFRNKNGQLHPYYPLIIVLIVCAVLGSIAICFLPDREPRPLQHWRGLSHVEDSMIVFASDTSFSVASEFELPTAFTSDGERGVLVGGGGINGENCGIAHYSGNGEILARFKVPALPTDIVLGKENSFYKGKILVAYRYGVWVCDWSGNQLQGISAPVPLAPEQETFISAIVVVGDRLFMADAMQGVIYRFTPQGQCDLVINQTTALDETGNPFPGFAPDSVYFDMVPGPDDTILVASPKNRHVFAFRADGTWLPAKSWAKDGYSFLSLYQNQSSQLPSDEFFVDNPVSLASLADGRIVTVERIVNQVKVFSETGDFLGFVMPPTFFGNEQNMAFWYKHEQLRQEHEDIWFPSLVIDTLPDGRVMILDQNNPTVYIFREK